MRNLFRAMDSLSQGLCNAKKMGENRPRNCILENSFLIFSVSHTKNFEKREKLDHKKSIVFSGVR